MCGRSISNLSKYFHTLRYLKFIQIYYRIFRKFKHPKVQKLKGNCADASGEWFLQALYKQKILNEVDVYFLNNVCSVSEKIDWNTTKQEKLWLYNLHYFDDLVSFDARSRYELHKFWINKWINDNPAKEGGNGWEPYTLSLRIVNWVKWALSGASCDQKMLDSLVQQADFLSQDLEFHLLGNHLFVNAKALIFAGIFFEGKDAEKWLGIGVDIYSKELDRQILPDGGNFELTPMYHSIMLIDLLDLMNLWCAYPQKINPEIVKKTRKLSTKMLGWLETMSHSDGEISFFNDTAFSIAPKNSVVYEYASKLGIKKTLTNLVELGNIALFNLTDSGYTVVKSREYSLIADLAHVGPSYQPGHAHADTFSFEFSLAGQRIFVNSGISEYGLSEERLRQRKTPAHNTVSVNGLDSSHVWSGFRVAQRARVANRVVGAVIDNKVSFGASHDGFKQQGIDCEHFRQWSIGLDKLLITDNLKGEFEVAVGYLHLHPCVDVIEIKNDKVILATEGYIIDLNISGSIVTLESTTWHPEFGMTIPNKKLCFEFSGCSMAIEVCWRKKEELASL